MSKIRLSYILCSYFILNVILLISCSTNQKEEKEPSFELSREQILEARKHFEVEVISYEASQKFGTEIPYSDYVRLRITNASNVTLPYLTVLTKRFDKNSKLVGSSRMPPINVSNIKPSESFEYDYYPRGHLPGVSKMTVEIEQIIDESELQFIRELQL